MSLWPKEHGVYGQLGFPLLTVFAVAGPATAGLLLGGAVVMVFLAHEPLMVRLGRRGPRVKQLVGFRAEAWLAVAAVGAVCLGLTGLLAMPGPARWSLLVPALPAATVGAAIALHKEKSSVGEVAVAVTFSVIALPVGLAAGLPTRSGVAIGAAFGVLFVIATLAVRVVIHRRRAGGQPSVVRTTWLWLLAVTVVGCGGLALAGARGLLPWTALMAPGPGIAGSWALAALPPPPTRLRAVGWTLVGAAAVTSLILIAGLRLVT